MPCYCGNVDNSYGHYFPKWMWWKNTKSSIPSGTAANEILTLSPVAQYKELVTIHYEYGLNIAGALEQTIADLKSKHQNVISEIYQLGKNITAL